MKLVLLDSNALVHRAYHAIPPNLTSPSGEPTNATYGFAATLLKVLAEEKPDYMVAAFDVGPSFRHEQFAAYKATRPKLAEDLAVQLKRAREVADTLGVPTYGVERFEADDLLGTLAKHAAASGVETVIVTGDTDTFQLIGPHVRVLTFSRQFGDLVLYDEAAIQERFQLEPRQLIDYKALKGDSSDNIPGVAGVGDKTATRLLQTFDSLEGIYAHLDAVEAKTREKLVTAREQALLNKGLVTIRCDAPVELDLAAARVAGFDRERLAALFRELGFRSLLDRLTNTLPDAGEKQAPAKIVSEAPTPPDAGESPKEDFHTVDTVLALERLVKKMRARRPITVDVETTDTDAMRARLVGIAIGLGEGEAYYIPIAQPAPGTAGFTPDAIPAKPSRKGRDAKKQGQGGFGAQLAFETPSEYIASPAEGTPTQVETKPRPGLDVAEVVEKLRPVFEDERIPKYGHNIKYDATVLAEAGVELCGLAFDSMVAAHLLEPSGQSIGLKNLVWSKFGVEMQEIQTLIGKGKSQITMAQVDVAQAATYACSDASYTERLVQYYRPQLNERGQDRLFEELEMPLVPVLVEMERTGVLLDIEFLGRMSDVLAGRLQELEQKIQAQVGAPINIASPLQLADALFKRLRLPTQGLPKTKTGQISTAADVLETLRGSHAVIDLILEHRELSKLKGTYVDALPALVNPRTGRLHTDYNQTGTVTGRVSSSNPNLQNIPVRTELGRQVRRAFIAPQGCRLISADYSQVELRILADISGDANLLSAFARGEDIHAATAARLYDVTLDQVTSEMRRVGKTINFGIAYGITGFGIAARTDLSQEKARQMIEHYFQEYPGIRDYVERTKAQARDQGYVQTQLGRRRYFPELSGTTRVHPSLRNAAEREAINMPIQGTAADIIKIAMVRLQDALTTRRLRSRMTLQVHDELVLECPEEETETVAPLVRETMEGAYPLKSKLRVELSAGQNWDEMLPVV